LALRRFGADSGWLEIIFQLKSPKFQSLSRKLPFGC
jgi:hypothetical protein